MTNLLREVLEDRAARAGEADPDLAAIVAAGERRRRRTRGARAGGVLVLAAATVAVIAVAGLPGGDPGANEPGTTQDPDWSPRDLSYATGSAFHLPDADATLDAGGAVRSYVATDDGFVWAADDGTVSFQPATGEPGVAIGATSPEGRFILAGDDAGSLAAWIDSSTPADPQLVVYDTAERAEVLRNGDDTGPGMDAMPDGSDVITVFGIDGDAVTWLNRAGVVRTDVATGETERLGRGGGFAVEDVGSGLIASDAGGESGVPRTRVGPSLADGRDIPHSGSATISPGGDYVSFEDADELVVTDVATGEDVQPANPGYDYWVVTQWLDDRTFGGFGIRSVDDEESSESGPTPLELVRCDVPTGECTVVDEVEIDPESFALPVGESLS